MKRSRWHLCNIFSLNFKAQSTLTFQRKYAKMNVSLISHMKRNLKRCSSPGDGPQKEGGSEVNIHESKLSQLVMTTKEQRDSIVSPSGTIIALLVDLGEFQEMCLLQQPTGCSLSLMTPLDWVIHLGEFIPTGKLHPCPWPQ